MPDIDCPNCGAANPSDVDFCPHCRVRFSSSASGSQALTTDDLDGIQREAASVTLPSESAAPYRREYVRRAVVAARRAESNLRTLLVVIGVLLHVVGAAFSLACLLSDNPSTQAAGRTGLRVALVAFGGAILVIAVVLNSLGSPITVSP